MGQMDENQATKTPEAIETERKRAVQREKMHLLMKNDRLAQEVNAASDSFYYDWWRCLRESAEYQLALDGKLGEPWSSMAADFGDLGSSFAAWWVDPGRYLFDHQLLKPEVTDLDTTTVLFEDKSAPYMYVEVPLTLHRREIIRQFNELLDTHLAQAERLAEPMKAKRSLYPEQRIRHGSIKNMLAVWQARKNTTDEWWQTGEKCELGEQYICLPGDDAETIKQKRRTMSLTAQRMYRMATALIDFAARGDFPRIK